MRNKQKSVIDYVMIDGASVGILLIGPLWTNFNEILIKIHEFSFKKLRLKMSSAKYPPFRLGLNLLNIKVKEYMTLPAISYIPMERAEGIIPVGTRHNNNVIMTSKRICDVVFAPLWRYHCVVCPLWDGRPTSSRRTDKNEMHGN